MNLNRIRRKSNLINFLVLLFLTHGFLFFLYPQDIYNINSPIRYIKYIIIILLLVIVLNESKTFKIINYLLVSISLMLINIIAVGTNFSLISFMNHIVPLSVFFFYDGISKHINTYKIAITTYVIMTFFGYFEYFFLHGLFARFADSGYRIVSIYINPNNLGLVIVLLTVYILGKKIINKLGMVLIFLNSLMLIFLSGSRNSMLVVFIIATLYTMGFVANIIKKMKIKITSIIFAGVGCALFVAFLAIFSGILNIALQSLLLKTRSLTNTDLFSGRLNQYARFLDNASESVIFPYQRILAYTDNLYFHIWGTFGLLILAVFLILNLYLLIKTVFENKKQHFMLLLVFLLSGVAENIIYLWPLAYFYWYLVGGILKKDSTTMEEHYVLTPYKLHL